MTYLPGNRGFVSTLNSTAATLGGGATYTGTKEDVTQYGFVTVFVFADVPGTLYIDFSTDGSAWDLTRSYPISASTPDGHETPVFSQYMRVRYENGAVAQGSFRLQSMLHSASSLIVKPLAEQVASMTDAQVSSAILSGRTVGGTWVQAGLSSGDKPDKGYLNTQILGPRSMFGDVITAEQTPMAQADFVVPKFFPSLFANESYNGAVATITSYQANLYLGVTANAYFHCKTRRLLRYRALQGAEVRLTATFANGTSGTSQLAGIISPKDGFAFGYTGPNFGIMRRYGGFQEIRDYTVTTASTTAETISVTLDGTIYRPTVTNSASTIVTAQEIAQGSYPGWDAFAVGSSGGNPRVTFLSRFARTQNGLYGVSGTSVRGTFARVMTGAAPNEDWVAQSSWNIDPMMGTGPSSQTLNPQYNNTYVIDYRRFGALFMLEDLTSGRILPVHRFQSSIYADGGIRIVTPGQAPGWYVGSLGATGTGLTFKGGSVFGAMQGKVKHLGLRRAISRALSSVPVTLTPVISIRNPLTYTGIKNSAEYLLCNLAVCTKGNTPTDFFLILNPTLTTPNFYDVSNSDSTAQFDVTATVISGGTVKFAVTQSDTSSSVTDLQEYDLVLEPGDVMTIAASSNTGTHDVDVALSYIEDV